jgi:hypothetical protein
MLKMQYFEARVSTFLLFPSVFEGFSTFRFIDFDENVNRITIDVGCGRLSIAPAAAAVRYSAAETTSKNVDIEACPHPPSASPR